MTTTQQLIEKYIPLANKLAFDRKKTLPKFVDIEELQSAAYLGLTEAANRFDESRGISFSTFAYPRILGAIVDSLRQMGWGKRTDPKQAFSLDVPVSDEADMSLKDMLAAPEEHNINEIFEVISQGFDKQAEQVLRHYFIDECSMKEVGKKFGVSESRISQLISQYKMRIRDNWEYADLQAELAA